MEAGSRVLVLLARYNVIEGHESIFDTNWR